MVIKAPSKVLLDIANQDIAGDKALLNNMFEVEGNASLLLKFEDLFYSPEKNFH